MIPAKVLALALTLALLGAACGEDDVDEAAPGGTEDEITTTTETTTGETTTTGGEGSTPPQLDGTTNDHGVHQLEGSSFALELDDFYFDPAFVATDGGKSVTVEMTNEGDAAHTFTVDSLGIDEVVNAGESAEVTLDLPEEVGTLRYYCRFHTAQGMQGAFFSPA